MSFDLLSADLRLHTASNQSVYTPRCLRDIDTFHRLLFLSQHTPATLDLLVFGIERFHEFSEALASRKLHHRLSVLLRFIWSTIAGHRPVISLKAIR